MMAFNMRISASARQSRLALSMGHLFTRKMASILTINKDARND